MERQMERLLKHELVLYSKIKNYSKSSNNDFEFYPFILSILHFFLIAERISLLIKVLM